MEISKSAVLLANEHHCNQKNDTNDFRINFRYVFVHAKTTLSLECQKIRHQEGFKPKWQPYYFKEYKAISKLFAGTNHQYMGIYNTKKQTENTPRACSYLLLKILFYFILQCISIPYLEKGLCK